MSRKKLPRAILRSTGELPEAGPDASEQRKPQKSRRKASKTSPRNQAAQSTSAAEPTGTGTARQARALKASPRDRPAQPASPPDATKIEPTPRSASKSSKPIDPAIPKSTSPDDATQIKTPAGTSAWKVSSHDQLSPPEPTSPRGPASAEPAPEATSPPIEGEILPPVLSTHTAPPQAPDRRAVAEKVVDRYKLYAAMGGLSPIPIVTAASVTIAILQMVKTLSNLYEVPFERDLTKSVIVGLMGGAVPTGLGAATASALALAVPGVGFVGIAVSVLTAAELTGRIGLVFVDRFESGAMPPTVGKSDE
jgi:uncharacterized protein (DUF697 family)